MVKSEIIAKIGRRSAAVGRSDHFGFGLLEMPFEVSLPWGRRGLFEQWKELGEMPD